LRLTLLLLLLVALAAPAAATPGLALRDGVVVDADRALAYVMQPTGGIAAIDLELGSVVWSNDQAARPLAVVNGLLLAQAEGQPGKGLRLLTLDPEAGGKAGLAAEVALPAGMHNVINDGLNGSLRVSAVPSKGGALIAWKATQNAPQAMIPGPQDGQTPGTAAATLPGKSRAARVLEGVSQLDLGSGATHAVLAKSAIQAPGSLRELLGADRLDGVAGRQFLSVDGRHVLASSRLEKPKPLATYRWKLYERSSGQLLGGFVHSASAAPFMVIGKQVIFEARATLRAGEGAWQATPLELRAINLLSGTPIWKVAVRDTSFQGPFPH